MPEGYATVEGRTTVPENEAGAPASMHCWTSCCWAMLRMSISWAWRPAAGPLLTTQLMQTLNSLWTVCCCQRGRASERATGSRMDGEGADKVVCGCGWEKKAVRVGRRVISGCIYRQCRCVQKISADAAGAHDGKPQSVTLLPIHLGLFVVREVDHLHAHVHALPPPKATHPSPHSYSRCTP